MLAPRFGLSPAELGAICDTQNIPWPPAGYWSKRVAGTLETDMIPALPPSPTETVEITKAITKSQMHAQAWQAARDTASSFVPKPSKRVGRPLRQKNQTDRNLPDPPMAEETQINSVHEVHPPPLAYSAKGLAQALSLSVATIYKLANQGELHPIKVGGRTLFVASDIIEWLEQKLSEAKA